jgi:hypothetical protein
VLVEATVFGRLADITVIWPVAGVKRTTSE